MFLLSLIQGITEFLPISSSLHLSLLSMWFGLPSIDLLTKTFLHVGTAVSVLIYYGSYIWEILIKRHYRTIIFYITATIPVIIGGFLFKKYLDQTNPFLPAIVGMTGLLLFIADYCSKQTQHDQELTIQKAIVIGLCQMLALFPGASRLGMCFFACRFLKMSRLQSFNISMLLSLPPSLGAFVLEYADHSMVPSYSDYGVLITTSIIGLITLWVVKKYVPKVGFWMFGIYRMILSIILMGLMR
jgi:undecaprenyl-diphosphatase